MKLGLLQLNPTVGDLEGNARRILMAVWEAQRSGADLCVTSEMALLGYPPRDLLLDDSFLRAAEEKARALARALSGSPPLLLGTVERRRRTGAGGKPLHNAALLLRDGRVAGRFRKSLLPTYDVFDEDRYFEPGGRPDLFEAARLRIGVTICEDAWNDRDFWPERRYRRDPLRDLAGRGVDLVVNLSASPFSLKKQTLREAMLSGIASKYGVAVCYVNQVGGNDDLVFDGRSCVFDRSGRLIARAKAFEEDVRVADPDGPACPAADDMAEEFEVWRALVLGTRDYARKCGFRTAVLGLSGGIDSALTAAVAVEALGPESVLGVLMPSPYSSRGSVDDALRLAENLGMKTETLPLEGIMRAYDRALAGAFGGRPPDVTEENIQARIRGNLLMALANKFGSLPLTTGNKSELAVGYCTIYGDMSGGFAVLADVPKTLVYRIARWLNERRERDLIPAVILAKAPSAELRPDQTDQDSLPSYEVLDRILELYIEKHRSLAEIAADGLERDTVAAVLRLVNRAEFKRRQAAPGVKVTDRAFGTGWRMPIACKVGPWGSGGLLRRGDGRGGREGRGGAPGRDRRDQGDRGFRDAGGSLSGRGLPGRRPASGTSR